MAAQVTLGDLLLAHDGINDTIRQFYPHLQQQEDEEEEEGEDEKKAGTEDRTTTTTTTFEHSEVKWLLFVYFTFTCVLDILKCVFHACLVYM